MKHYETTNYGRIVTMDYPKEWFGTKESAEEQGVYTRFSDAKARAIKDINEEISLQKTYLEQILEQTK